MFEITGDQIDISDDLEGGNNKMMTEEVELWRRDPVEGIHELIGNPAFQLHMRYAPEKVFIGAKREDRKFGEMWTLEWWWGLQVLVTLLFWFV